MSKNRKVFESPYQANHDHIIAQNSQSQSKIVKQSRKISRKYQSSDKKSNQKNVQIISLQVNKDPRGLKNSPSRAIKQQSHSAKSGLIEPISQAHYTSPFVKNKLSSLSKHSERLNDARKKGQQLKPDTNQRYSLPKNLSQAKTDKGLTQKQNVPGHNQNGNSNLSPLQFNNKQKIRMHLVSLIKPSKMKTTNQRQKDYVLGGQKDRNIFQNVGKEDKERKSSFNEVKIMQKQQYNRINHIKKRQSNGQIENQRKLQTQLPQENKQRQPQIALKKSSHIDFEKTDKLNDVRIDFPFVNFQSTKKSKMTLPSIQKQKEREKSHTYETSNGKTNENKINIYKHNILTDVLIPSQSNNHVSRKKYYAHASTKAGSNLKGQKKNQDAFIIQNTLPLGVKFYCICDGHGANGHLVSEYIKQILPKNLTMLLKKYSNSASFNHSNKNHMQAEEQIISQIFKQAFQKTNGSLLSSDINTELSGSTVVGVFIYKDTVFCLNVGDSRAVLGSIKQQEEKFYLYNKKQSNGKYLQPNYQIVRSPFLKRVWKCKALSIDQTPQRQDQRKRIMNHGGGVIKRQKDERGNQVGPQRVWKKDMGYPGLAMTRSFGDKAGVKAGTNGQPEIICHKLTKDDRIIVVASDGVWEYLDNSRVVEICGQFYEKQSYFNQLQEPHKKSQADINTRKDIQKDIQIIRTVQKSAQKVVKESFEQWEKLCYTRDDITAIVLMIRHPHRDHDQLSHDKRVSSSLVNQNNE